jgi:hypothetical protein
MRIRGVPNERNTLVHLDDSRIQRRWSADVEIKDSRTRLVAYEKKVFEPFRDEQGVFSALALEECVCGDSGG